LQIIDTAKVDLPWISGSGI